MGSCFGRCCPFEQLRRKLARSTPKFEDQTNLVEFECLMMETSPCREEPISISSMLSFRRAKRQTKREEEEEELELEEEVFIEARREASRVARLGVANSQQMIINPARLVFRDRSTSWHEDEPDFGNGNQFEDDLEMFIDENKLRTLTSRKTTYLPSHSSFLDSGDSSSFSSLNGRLEEEEEEEDYWAEPKKNEGDGSTPLSSLDLEWDEAGVFVNGATASNKNSTPASNDLEWDDNDFDHNSISSSPHHHHHLNDNLDEETEQLICEIEKLTSNALQETMRNDYR